MILKRIETKRNGTTEERLCHFDKEIDAINYMVYIYESDMSMLQKLEYIIDNCEENTYLDIGAKKAQICTKGMQNFGTIGLCSIRYELVEPEKIRRVKKLISSWDIADDGWFEYYYCHNCGNKQQLVKDDTPLPATCPKCGLKMIVLKTA